MSAFILLIKKSILGLSAGLISGLFATGGGMILVPAFIYFFKIDSKKSRGTSVLCILVMVLTSSYYYSSNNYINWKTAILCAIGGVIGGTFGARLLKKMPEKIFKIIFLIFLIFISCKMM